MSKQFLSFLTDDKGKSLTIEDGVVVAKAIPDPLNNSPEGWEKSTIQFARNNEFKGIIKSYTTPLKFFFEGAKILRTYFYTKGVEAILYFIWLKQNLNFGAGMKYEGWYKGEPDLSTFKDGYEGVEVNITEGGFYKQLQANKNIPYEVPFDDYAVSIEMDGIEIFNKLTFIAADDFEYQAVSNIDIPAIPQFRSSAILMPFVNAEGTNFTVATNSQEYENFYNTTDEAVDIAQVQAYANSSSNYFIKNVSSQNQIINFNWDLIFNAIINNGGYKARLQLVTSSGQKKVVYDSSPNENQVYKIPVNETITLEPEERVFVILTEYVDNGGVIKFYFMPESKLIVDFASRKETTVINAYRSFDLGNKLCKLMSGNKSTLQSNLLSNDYNLLITSGDAIRGISGSVIKTKFSDYHKSIDAVKCISFGVENNNGKLEERTYAYSDVEIADLGECRNFKLEVANEFRYNKIEVGYPAKDIEDLNGKYSFNNTIVYKTSILRGGDNTYDAKSLYFADPYAIEIPRINLEFKTTTDNKSDNDVFFIDGERIYDNYVGEITFSVINSISNLLINQIGLALKAGTRFKVLGGNNVMTFTVISAIEIGVQTQIQVKEGINEEVVNTEIEFLHYKLRRLSYTSIEGVPSPSTIFNIELSPKRILMNHYRWIHSSLDLLDTTKLVFQTTEKNSALITTDANNVVIKEKEDIPVAILGSNIFKPYYLSFEVESPLNLLELMSANSGGYFTFSVNNIKYRGYVSDIKTNEATMETQDYKLLATANNDFTTLINGR